LESEGSYLPQLGWEQLPEIRDKSFTWPDGTSSSDSRRSLPERRTKIKVRELADHEGSSPAVMGFASPPLAGIT
jgi:hypothetical protein